MKMVPQVEKEAAAPLKAKATVKALKPTKQCSKASTATKKKKKKKKIWTSHTFWQPKTLWLKAVWISLEEHP